MGRPAKVSFDQASQSAVRNILGVSLKDLALELGCSNTALFNAWRRNGIYTPTAVEKNSYPIDSDCFESITDDSAYWLGFAMTDGSNDGHGKGRGVAFALQIRDVEHLEKFKAFTKFGGPIHRRIQKRGFGIGREHCYIRVGNPKVSADLTKWGVTPNKTFTATAHPDLVLNRHFWRGAVDGDGWVTKGMPLQVGLCGAKNLVSQFSEFVLHITGFNPVVTPDRNIYKLWVGGQIARSLLNVLYSDCKYYLDRKMKNARFHMEYKLNPLKEKKSDALVSSIIELRKSGLSSNLIGKALGISKNTAMRYIKLSEVVS